MKISLPPFIEFYNDFRYFTWSKMMVKGYALHGLVAYILTDLLRLFIPYAPIVITLVFLLGVLWEVMRSRKTKKREGIKPDYADARWMLYLSIINYLIHLI